jgi:hypothetical protein
VRRLAPLLLALAGCGGPSARPLPTESALVRDVQPEGKFLVCVIDVSESMDSQDPRHYNEMGAHLAVALAGSLDNFGAVSFGSRAQVLAPLRALSGRSGRRGLHDEIARAGRRGQTNFVDALRLAHGMLASARAPAGSSIVFLTDGRHNTGGEEADVLAEVRAFQARDWRIFTIGLSEEGESPLLQQMSVSTKGAHFPVQRAEELMMAFLTILGQIHNFMFFEGEPEPVHLLPGTDRFVYVVLKRTPDATVSSVLRDGLAVDPKSRWLYKHPEAADSRSDLEIVSIENPPAGLWDIAFQGDARVGAILQRPPFSVRLDESLLRSDYYEGESLDLAVLVEGGGEDVIRHVRERGRASAQVRSPLGSREGPRSDLAAAPGRGDPVRFSGRLELRPLRAAVPELQTLAAQFLLPEKGGGVWRREARLSVLVKPGKRPELLRAAPAVLDLGARWSDAGTAAADLSLFAGVPRPTSLRSLSPAVRLGATSAVAVPEGARVQILVDPSELPPGPFESSVEVVADGAPPIRIPVRMHVGVVDRALARDGLRLPDLAPGERIEAPLPAGTRDVSPLEGPGSIATRIAEGKLAIAVPADAKDGDYAGRLTLRAPGLPDREAQLRLRVKPTKADLTVEPAEVVLEAAKPGTYAKEVGLLLTYPRETELRIEPGDLKGKDGTILAAYVSLVPAEDGWNGATLAPGKRAMALVRVKVKSDHLNGEYAGTIRLSAANGTAELRVRVKVAQ